jgi:DNA-3-methyladenine glycosylase II
MPRTPQLPSRRELTRLAKADPVLGRALRDLGPYPGFPQSGPQARDTHFAMLARSIVYQQLAARAASTIFGRVHSLTPGSRFPTPRDLLDLPLPSLRAAGLSANKARSLLDLADRVESGRLALASIARLPDDIIIERLVQVRGIGVWTAQMFLIFRLGRLDVMPSDDLGVREGLRRLDGLAERPAPASVIERAVVWSPLRTIAAWTLWRVTDA